MNNNQSLPLPPIVNENAGKFRVMVACRRNSAIHSWDERQHVRVGVIISIEQNPYGAGFAYYVAFDGGTSFDYAPLVDKPHIVKIIPVYESEAVS